jgi:hypothetical protein
MLPRTSLATQLWSYTILLILNSNVQTVNYPAVKLLKSKVLEAMKMNMTVS